MFIEEIKKVNPSKLDANAKKVYEKLKEKSNNFDPDYLVVYESLEEAVKEFVDVVKKKYPDAIRIVRKKQPKETPPVPETDDKEVIEAMKDYNLSEEKAKRLIKLRHEASEARKESLDKMLDKLRESEFYDERSTSKTAIDKNRSRDLGKDTNRGSITFKDEIRMTGRPFKRISKNGKTYYEYRLNRRDIDHKIRLAKGGLADHGLMRGDTIIDDMFWSNEAVVRDAKGVLRKVDIAKGKRYAKGGGVGGNVLVYEYNSQSDYEKNNLLKERAFKDFQEAESFARLEYNKNNRKFVVYNVPTMQYFYFGIKKFAKGGAVKAKDANYLYIVSMIENNEKALKKNMSTEKAEETQREIQRLKDKLKNEYGQSYAKGGGWVLYDEDTERLIKVYSTESEARKNLYEYEGNANIVEKSKWDDDDYFAKGGAVKIPNAEKMFHLPYELAVYVPSTKDVDKNITATELRARVKEVEKYLAELFGGFTSSEKVGGYLSSKSAIVTEKVIPVTSFATMEAFKAKKATLVNKMSVWAKKWGQEAIGFEFEGDLYYVPQKFKEGGKLKATYIPKRNIEKITTIFGQNIKGKDLIDGAYTKRKNVQLEPKMTRTMFEEETFEFAKGGKIGQSLEFEYMGDPMKGEIIEVLASGDYVVKSGTRTILVDDMNVTKYGEINKSRFGFYKKGGKTKKPLVVRYYFEDDGYEYAKGGHLDEEIDLFEDYENIPENVQAILEKHEDSFETGNYKGLEKALKEMNKIGYTFDYYLDGQAYNLRPIGSKGKHE
jgi:hypothetical protein